MSIGRKNFENTAAAHARKIRQQAAQKSPTRKEVEAALAMLGARKLNPYQRAAAHRCGLRGEEEKP
jgi:hypothetical protein